MSKTPKRFLWATELLNIEPHQSILEIGCGAGIFAEQINKRLSDGSFKAIDKSAAMIHKARKRNQVFIDSRRASFVVANFSDVNLPAFYYDTIVAFNVNLFWKEENGVFAKIKPALKQTGKLMVFYQPPFEVSIEAAEPIRQNLEKNSFELSGTLIQKFNPTSAICITARPSY